MKKINVLFMGTNDFACAILETLLITMKDSVNVIGVVCQPDRKVGRQREIMIVPIKNLALKHGIKVWQPEKIITSYEQLQTLAIDVIVTCAYGQFLPLKILQLPQKLCLNIHASLLPQLRGGAPIQWAIINGLKTTGITLMNMVSKMDAGAIYVQESLPITTDDTYLSLKKRLCTLAQQMIIKHLANIVAGIVASREQDESQVTYGLNIQRSDEKINWQQPATNISCHVRGLYDVPIAYTIMNNFIYKIHHVIISSEKSTLTPGTIVAINKNGIIVASTSNDIIIKVLQPAGKKPLIAAGYRGTKQNPLQVGLTFN